MYCSQYKFQIIIRIAEDVLKLGTADKTKQTQYVKPFWIHDPIQQQVILASESIPS